MVEKAHWQEREVAGHIATAVRKQRAVNAGARLTFSFLLVQGHSLLNGATQHGQVFLSQPN